MTATACIFSFLMEIIKNWFLTCFKTLTCMTMVLAHSLQFLRLQRKSSCVHVPVADRRFVGHSGMWGRLSSWSFRNTIKGIVPVALTSKRSRRLSKTLSEPTHSTPANSFESGYGMERGSTLTSQNSNVSLNWPALSRMIYSGEPSSIFDLPPMVSRELRTVAEIEEINLGSCSEGWHSWRNKHGGATVAVVGQRRQPQKAAPQHQQRQWCYRCGGPHLMTSRKFSLRCWSWGDEGQRASEFSGNDERKVFEPGAFPKFANDAAIHLSSTV